MNSYDRKKCEGTSRLGLQLLPQILFYGFNWVLTFLVIQYIKFHLQHNI